MNVIIPARSLEKTPFVKLKEERDLQPPWERPAMSQAAQYAVSGTHLLGADPDAMSESILAAVLASCPG